MFTINLEKELSKQAASKVNAEELLLIKEYDKLGEDVASSEVLERIGINKAVVQGKSVKHYNEVVFKEASQFNMDKVYHVSQIEKICKRYYLRFLPSALFKGNIDVALADKISTFEATYNVKCECNLSQSVFYYKEDEKGNNTFIAAPASSFALQERPKDPLLFYKINEEYYYLIHKWGNDLSIFRRLYSLLEKRLFLWTVVFLCSIIAASNIKFIKGGIHTAGSAVALCFLILSIVFSIFSFGMDEGGFTLVKKNDIKSRFL